MGLFGFGKKKKQVASQTGSAQNGIVLPKAVAPEPEAPNVFLPKSGAVCAVDGYKFYATLTKKDGKGSRRWNEYNIKILANGQTCTLIVGWNSGESAPTYHSTLYSENRATLPGFTRTDKDYIFEAAQVVYEEISSANLSYGYIHKDGPSGIVFTDIKTNQSYKAVGSTAEFDGIRFACAYSKDIVEAMVLREYQTVTESYTYVFSDEASAWLTHNETYEMIKVPAELLSEDINENDFVSYSYTVIPALQKAGFENGKMELIRKEKN